MSRASYKDDSLLGQPQGVASGQAGVILHKHVVSRSTGDIAFTLGNITSQFILQAEGNNAFSEQQQEISGTTTETLTPKHLAELKQHMLKAENFFLCLVDVEFATDQQDKLYILQARPL
jgi:phosphoenolpyruvate synthase/pyruvate phosphate dikinase